MRHGLPFDTLHEAIAAATLIDLPDIEYEDRDWEEFRKTKKDVRVKKKRRPVGNYDVDIDVFVQTWGSTALGYGGIGGAALTSAYTVVASVGYNVCVYFGCGRLAYKLNLGELTQTGLDNYHKDVRDHNMASCRDAVTRYERKGDTK